MPGPWVYIDASFPTFTGKESSEEQIRELTNYLALLVEQLKYSLSNLDSTNFNRKAMDDWAESSTEGLAKQVSSLSAALGQTNQTVAALQSSLEEAWEAIHELQGETAGDS